MLSVNSVNRLLESLSPDLAGATVLMTSHAPADSGSASPQPSVPPPSMHSRSQQPGRTARGASSSSSGQQQRRSVSSAGGAPSASAASSASPSTRGQQQQPTVPRRRQPLTRISENRRAQQQQQPQPQVQKPTSVVQTAPEPRRRASSVPLVVRPTGASSARQRRNRANLERASAPKTFYGAPIMSPSPTAPEDRAMPTAASAAIPRQQQQQQQHALPQRPAVEPEREVQQQQHDEREKPRTPPRRRNNDVDLLDRIDTPPPALDPFFSTDTAQHQQQQQPQQRGAPIGGGDSPSLELIHMSAMTADSSNSQQTQQQQDALQSTSIGGGGGGGTSSDTSSTAVRRMIRQHEQLRHSALQELRRGDSIPALVPPPAPPREEEPPAAAAAAAAASSVGSSMPSLSPAPRGAAPSSSFSHARAQQVRDRVVAEAQGSAKKRKQREQEQERMRWQQQQQQGEEEEEEQQRREERRKQRAAEDEAEEEERQMTATSTTAAFDVLRRALRTQPMASYENMLRSIVRALLGGGGGGAADASAESIPVAICEVNSTHDFQVACLLPVPLAMCISRSSNGFGGVEQLLAFVLQMGSSFDCELYSHGSTFVALRRRKQHQFIVWNSSSSSSSHGGHSSSDSLLSAVVERLFLMQQQQQQQQQHDRTPIFDICLFWRNRSGGGSRVGSDVWWRVACDVVKAAAQFSPAATAGTVLHDADVEADSAIGQMLSPYLLSSQTTAEEADDDEGQEVAVHAHQAPPLLLGCGIAVNIIESSTRKKSLRAVLTPFDPTYALWRRAPVSVSQQQQQQQQNSAETMTTVMSVVLVHDAAARIISFTKSACQGGLSNFGIVSGCPPSSPSQQLLQLAASNAGATFIGEGSSSGSRLNLSAVTVMRSALTVASDKMWRGVIVQLPAVVPHETTETGKRNGTGDGKHHDAWMDVLCRWPFECPSVVVVVSSSPDLEDFSSIRDGFEELAESEIVDRLLI